MNVRYTPRARGDLEKTFLYLNERNPQGTEHVLYAIRRVIELTGIYPYAGRITVEQDTRFLPVGRHPYLVYWSIEAGEVWILHIRHASRQPWKK